MDYVKLTVTVLGGLSIFIYGTGLGLAIVKHIVRLHGGDVFVTSRPGEKTTFGFTLPCV